MVMKPTAMVIRIIIITSMPYMRVQNITIPNCSAFINKSIVYMDNILFHILIS